MDVGEFIVPIPHVKQVKLTSTGGRLIIASDGIWDVLSSESAAKCCHGVPAELADCLVVKLPSFSGASVIGLLSSAIINKCGFNREGIVAVAKRLGAQHGKRKLETSSCSSLAEDDVVHGGKVGHAILGVNLGMNKTSEDATADYVQGVHKLSQYVDYLILSAGCGEKGFTTKWFWWS